MSTTTTEWALGIVASLLVAVVTATARMFGRVDRLEARLDAVDRDAREADGRHEKNTGEMFALLRDMSDKIADVRVDVAAIRRNGHGGK